MKNSLSNLEVKNVYNSGKSFANDFFVVYKKSNGLDDYRLCISISKKVGNSVVRHRYKRVVREIFRLNYAGVAQGFDVVIIIRSAILGMSFKIIEDKLGRVFRRF